MIMDFQIRKARKTDIPVICELGNEVSEFETSEDIVLFWPQTILENCLDKEDVLILVAEKDEKIIGFYVSNINQSLKKAEIENQYVVPEYRHQGYGRALLNQTINELKAMGIENVCVMASDVVDFMLKNGFTKGNQYYWMDLALTDRFKK